MSDVDQTFDFGDGNGPVPAHRHVNPDGSEGGWVANTATVGGSAYVGGSATVSGNATVGGSAVVGETARVSDRAVVSGSAWISGDAHVGGDAHVSGDATVGGSAVVGETARVSDRAVVSGDAHVGGDAHVSGDATVSGDAVVDNAQWGLVIGPIGSRHDHVTWTRSDQCIATGCFRGTLAEFRASVVETHGDNEHGRAYLAMLEFIAAVDAAWGKP